MNEVNKWVKKAENDLASSKKLILGNNPILDTAYLSHSAMCRKNFKSIFMFTRK